MSTQAKRNLILVSIAAWTGCTNVRDPGTGACPPFGGSWTISDHCDSSYVGMPLPVTQSGCNWTSGPPFDDFSGTIGETGGVTVEGSIEGMPISCAGQLSGNDVALSCIDGCNVALTRGTSETCPSFAGSWRITDHCQTSYVGAIMNVSQTACSFTAGPPFDGFGGSVSMSGSVMLSGMIEGSTIRCTGQLNGDNASLACDEGCMVTLVRGGA
jgi:hypothetical protein